MITNITECSSIIHDKILLTYNTIKVNGSYDAINLKERSNRILECNEATFGFQKYKFGIRQSIFGKLLIVFQ